MDRRSEEEKEEMRINEDEKKNEIDQLMKRYRETLIVVTRNNDMITVIESSLCNAGIIVSLSR